MFREDGSFAFEAELAGEILTKPVGAATCRACKPAASSEPDGDGEERAARPEDFYGTLVHPQVVGVDHQHWFSLRLDFDVDGANNAVMENEVARVAPPGPEQAPAFTVTHRLLETAADAKRDIDDGVSRSWTVYNASAAGPTGRPAGYTIVPVDNTATMFPRSRERGPAGFTFHHLWVTPYRDGELFAGGRYPNQPPENYADALYHYAGAESVHDRDIVVWYSLGETHVVRPEDYPLMTNMKLSVRFVPDGFFARNPALGRAVEEGRAR